MVIQANVCAVGKIQTGTSQQSGNQWRKQEFVVEWFVNPNDTQSQKIVLSLMNDRIEQYNLQVGDKVEVRFDLRYREYQERFYQDVYMPYDGLKKISKVTKDTATLQPAQVQTAQQATNSPQQQNNAPQGGENQKGGGDDLPF
jgi:hypothetical protein